MKQLNIYETKAISGGFGGMDAANLFRGMEIFMGAAAVTIFGLGALTTTAAIYTYQYLYPQPCTSSEDN